nr:E3 ubiquitin-protein ligase DTX1-like [Aegilops tauschii subsp. strangulata]
MPTRARPRAAHLPPAHRDLRPHPRPKLAPPWPPPPLQPPTPGRAGSARPLPQFVGARWHPRPPTSLCALAPLALPRRPAAPVAACTCVHRPSPVRPALPHRVVARRRTHAHGSGPLRPAALFRPALVRPLAAGAHARLCRVTWAGYARTRGSAPFR